MNYTYLLYKKYLDIKNGNMDLSSNFNLWKLFEYFVAIKNGNEFLLYDDIDNDFKLNNKLNATDSGIDICNLSNTIIQCKLRSKNLTLRECSTFLASQNIFDISTNQTIIKWNNLIIAHNNNINLSPHLNQKLGIFTTQTYSIPDLLSFCESLLINPPTLNIKSSNFNLRYYQKEAINLIKSSNKKIIICIPTGCGKNSIIIHSIDFNKSYLILVPRIILMYQLKNEFINHFKHSKHLIQLIGDNHNSFNPDKKITICVYNSFDIIHPFISSFHKIFIDEAHHIHKPYIYSSYFLSDSDSDTNSIISNNNTQNINYNDNIDNEEDEEDEDENEEYTDEEYDEEEYEEEEEQVEEDELRIEYNRKIREIKSDNIVLLSATIDSREGYDEYRKEIREMIEEGYLTDYNIRIPIFSGEKKDMESIARYIINRYRSIIIFCKSQKEGREMNMIMNKICNNSSEYIDCNTKTKKRDEILNKFNSGELAYIINVRLLIEGFNSNIANGILLLKMTENETNLIQMIGRTLRLHENKKIANIIYPITEEDNEIKVLNKFIKIIAENDKKIMYQCKNKIINNYINIEKAICNNDDLDDNNEKNNELYELKEEIIMDSLGNIKECYFETFKKKIDEIEIYMKENGKRPCGKDKKTRQMHDYLKNLLIIYKNKSGRLKDNNFYSYFKNFLERNENYFASRENKWNKNLNDLINYIEKYNKKPSIHDKNSKNKYLARWMFGQTLYYKLQTNIFINKEINDKWEIFIKTYNKFFEDNNTQWHNKLESLNNYIIQNKKLPDRNNKNKYIASLNIWICTQNKNYLQKKEIMKDNIIRNEWNEFKNKHENLFSSVSNENKWLIKFQQLTEFLIKYNQKPTKKDKSLYLFILRNNKNLKYNTQIMKNENIKNKWKEFIQKYNNFL